MKIPNQWVKTSQVGDENFSDAEKRKRREEGTKGKRKPLAPLKANNDKMA